MTDWISINLWQFSEIDQNSYEIILNCSEMIKKKKLDSKFGIEFVGKEAGFSKINCSA